MGDKKKKYKVLYKKSVKKDLKSLSPEIKEKIKSIIETKLSVDPLLYGIPLRKTLKKYFKYRLGDYRIIYSIDNTTVIIYIFKVGHRKDVYEV